MRFLSTVLLFIGLCLLGNTANAQTNYQGIASGTPWFDDRGKIVSAHGANIIKENGRYYLFGEIHSDTSNAFVGFNCYSSRDLYNWKFERIALPVQDSGRLCPNRVGERPKVLKCPKTGEYVMLMHTDNMKYADQATGYATSKNITGPYTFKGPILYKGQPIRKWDMGSFQDDDGAGYLIIHSGLLYKLSDDFHSIAEEVVDNKWKGSESPAIFKKNGVYFWLASDLTSWERNDNFYYTATSLKGPWVSGGNFAPLGTLTWNSQTSFVLPIIGTKDTTFMFMGDRWSSPHQASSATYVWQPITVTGNQINIPEYRELWQLNTTTGQVKAGTLPQTEMQPDHKSFIYNGDWAAHTTDKYTATRSNVKGNSFMVKFNGTQAGLYCLTGPESGYANITLINAKGEIVKRCMVDTYSKYNAQYLVFLSQKLSKGNYTLTVTVAGEHGNWTDKRKSIYGSKDNFVAVSKVLTD